MDYRELKGKFDRIYSVGMFEHVGKKFYKTFFKSINTLLQDNGIFLLHTIGSVEAPTPPNKFINKYFAFSPSGKPINFICLYYKKYIFDIQSLASK